MGNAANDDDDSLPFIRIAAATANVMAFLEATKQQKKEANDNASSSGDEQKDSDEHRRAVDQRLRDLAAFEAGFTPNKDLKRVR